MGFTKVLIDIHIKHSETLISLIKQREKEENRENRNKKKNPHKTLLIHGNQFSNSSFITSIKKNLLKESYMQFKKYLHCIITDQPVSAVMVSG